MDRLLCVGHRGAVGIASGCAAVFRDGHDEYGTQWRAAYRGGRVSVDSAQARLPDGLPVTAFISYGGVARRYWRSLRDGIAAWIVLRGMLLGSDGAAIRGG